MDKRRVGRPKVSDGVRKGIYGLRQDQLERLSQEATVRQIPIANMLRHIVDWYFTALDAKRTALVTPEQQEKTPKQLTLP